VGRANPPVPYGDRPVVHAGDPELLESLYASDDIDQSVQSSHLVQGDSLRWDTVHFPFRLPHQPKGPASPILDPGRQRRALHHAKQIADVTVREMTVIVAVRVAIVTMRVDLHQLVGTDVARSLKLPARKSDVHLDGIHAATGDPTHFDLDFRDAQPRWKGLEPIFGRTRCHECAEKHVPADAGGRIENREAAILHRLTISPRLA
jgi:hypothetical protein